MLVEDDEQHLRPGSVRNSCCHRPLHWNPELWRICHLFVCVRIYLLPCSSSVDLDIDILSDFCLTDMFVSPSSIFCLSKLVRQDFEIEAYDTLRRQCIHLEDRLDLVAGEKHCPAEVKQAVCTIIWAADKAEVSQMVTRAHSLCLI